MYPNKNDEQNWREKQVKILNVVKIYILSNSTESAHPGLEQGTDRQTIIVKNVILVYIPRIHTKKRLF